MVISKRPMKQSFQISNKRNIFVTSVQYTFNIYIINQCIIKCNSFSLKDNLLGWRDSTACSTLALHVPKPGSNSIQYDPLSQQKRFLSAELGVTSVNRCVHSPPKCNTFTGLSLLIFV